MPLFTAITTICTKLVTGAVFCAVSATTDIPNYDTQAECTAYYTGRLDGVLAAKGSTPVFSKATCETPNHGKMIISAAPGNFDDEGWLYTMRVSKYE